MVSPVVPGATPTVATPFQPGGQAEQAGTSDQRPVENTPQPAQAALAENQTAEQDTLQQSRDREDKEREKREVAARDQDEDTAADFEPDLPRGSIVNIEV